MSPTNPVHNSQLLSSLVHKVFARIFFICHFGSEWFNGLSTLSMSSKDGILFIIVSS